MKEDKELIKEIVDKLKSTEDYAYKEGAWENFKSKSQSSSVIYKHMQRYVSIAAMLLISFGIAYYTFVSKGRVQDETNIANELFTQIEPESHVPKKLGKDARDKENNVDMTPSASVVSNGNSFLKDSNLILPDHLESNDLVLSSEMSRVESIVIDSLNEQFFVGTQMHVSKELNKIKSNQELLSHLVLANATLTKSVLANNRIDQSISPKSFKLAEKFDLGLFVSPFSNSDNLKVGAGLTLAYNINNKISIRTGASFNTYEVGVLKNPFESSSVEQVMAKVEYSGLQDAGSNSAMLQTSKVTLPNINAVTGFVRSLEVPLEVKYNVGKSFYAVAGASYSTIVNQERNAQYIENVNYNTFENGFPENEKEASEALKVVTKTVKSSENNVSTSGFNGFINLSIGKKLKVNNKFGLSIEPYYKIPVGEFRKADMNYSNGGVRIMTNF